MVRAPGAPRRHRATAGRRGGGRAGPSVAERGRLARVFRDATCYRATTRRTSAFRLFFAPPRRDRPRIARVNVRRPRPTGDGASARLPPIVKAPKNRGVHPPRAYAAHARTHVRAVRTHGHGWCTVWCSCRWCSTGEEAWSAFSAPVSNRHGPLPQPRTQQGELRSRRALFDRDRALGRRPRSAENDVARESPSAADRPHLRENERDRSTPSCSAPFSPSVPRRPSAPLTLTPVPDLLARELSSYGRYYSPRLVDPS